MAEWVKQSNRPSDTTSALGRTRYLAELDREIDELVEEYFADRPDGETVTPFVLTRLGKARLESFIGRRKLGTVKQDVGRRIPIRMNELYTRDRVLTYRGSGGQPSTRPVPSDMASWIGKFTPHRLLPATRGVRIVLDTNVVREVIYGDESVDVDALVERRGTHPFSIADPAWAELVHSLSKDERGLSFDLWRRRAGELDRLLDPELPIVPSGQEAAVMSGLESQRGFDYSRAAAEYRAVWRLTLGANTMADFGRPMAGSYPGGEQFQIGPLRPGKLKEALEARHEQWKNFCARIGSTRESGALSVDDASNAILEYLGATMTPAHLDKLDLVVRTLALHAVRINGGRSKRTPDLNDAIDFDVMFTVTLPAVICTSDKGMLNLAHESGSGDDWRVKSPTELLDFLKSEPSVG